MSKAVDSNWDETHCHVPVLLILCRQDVDVDLDKISIVRDTARPKSSRPRNERAALFREVVCDGMVFRLSVDCTRDMGRDREINNLFTSRIHSDCPAVGIALGQHLVGGKHLEPINMVLLSIARTIGHELGATGVFWRPAKLHVDFAHFSEAVDHYVAGHIFPTIVQIGLHEPGNGRFETRGLHYFSGTEIRTLFPAQQSAREWMAHFLKITGALRCGDNVTRDSELLLNAPQNAQLTGCHRDGAVLEISYSELTPSQIEIPADQAAFGAASLTF
ncbi:hypothetical protein SAMN02745824_2296 [Parasphingorhabdus marina DSM 22363]|uniref:DUF4261 domain-containing protein n=1 Tax=Parasphingorhabdus marina DSM 22363 TaxID=1123272 RepID=A0A1N6F9C8_9SPHN|nr:hypothetical protein [Parasphingorhabdus marina]SIN91883.1 hypothetical protein SAMN02745824_2296 [Parasphingorhabdus marina DSM 22363]